MLIFVCSVSIVLLNAEPIEPEITVLKTDTVVANAPTNNVNQAIVLNDATQQLVSNDKNLLPNEMIEELPAVVEQSQLVQDGKSKVTIKQQTNNIELEQVKVKKSTAKKTMGTEDTNTLETLQSPLADNTKVTTIPQAENLVVADNGQTFTVKKSMPSLAQASQCSQAQVALSQCH